MRVAIVAGEPSGDAHAAALVKGVLAQRPGVQFKGIAGPQMRAAGVEAVVNAEVMAVVGLVEVLAHYPTLHRALERMRQLLREERPDLLVLVDYPDFNLRLAKTAKEVGVKVLYYISPQIWAWRQERVWTIKERVDMMAVVFPFEVPFYERAGVPVRYVGHPLSEEVNSALDKASARDRYNVPLESPVLGLLPGSRRSELKRLLPLMVESARLLHAKHPELHFLLPLSPSLDPVLLTPHLDPTLPITVVPGEFYETVTACDAVLTASGTATLEVALLGVPLAVVYRIKPLSYAIMSRMIKVDHIALCNIVAQRRIARELIQHDATPTKLVAEAERLLFDCDYAAAIRDQLQRVREKLAVSAQSDVSGLVVELLGD